MVKRGNAYRGIFWELGWEHEVKNDEGQVEMEWQ